MVFRHHKHYFSVLGGVAAIALTLSTALTLPASAQALKSALDQLPSQEQATLRGGRATVSGTNGQFVGRVLVNAPAATAWQVLTDYNNFERFFPNVENSRLLESNGNRRVFEQINVVRIFPITSRTRIVIAATETYPRQIDFRLVEGDVDALQGTWRIEPVAASNQMLITHRVSVDPEGSAATRGLFFGIYQDVLEDTLVAIKRESEQRARR